MLKKGGQELQARRLLSEPHAGLKDVRARQTRTFAQARARARQGLLWWKGLSRRSGWGLTGGCQGRQLVVGASPSFPSDGWRPVSKVDIGDGSLTPKKLASE